MVTLVKHEWHQVDSQFKYNLTLETLSEIYPEASNDELENILSSLKNADGVFTIEDVINDARDNDIEIEWDRTYDDWYTERKGGYDVTYEVDSTDATDETSSEVEEPNYPIQEVYPAGEYNISLRGYTIERGIGRITKFQYDYWEDRSEEDLGDALNDNFDYLDNNTPKECEFDNYYYDYTDVKFVHGGEESTCYVEITNADSQVIYDGPLSEFLDNIHSVDTLCDATEETDECYIEYEAKGKGPVVYWAQGGKGVWFDGKVIATAEFDPKKLKFETCDVEGENYIISVIYDGSYVENQGGSETGKWSDYSVRYIE